MPRSIWNGAIAFGAVTVPVKVFGALEDRAIHFSEVHLADRGGIAHQLVDPTTGDEVPRDKVVKGYEVSPGKWVVVTNDEIKAADQPRRNVTSSGRRCWASSSARRSSSAIGSSPSGQPGRVMTHPPGRCRST